MASAWFRELVSQYLRAARAKGSVPRTLKEAALYGPFEHLIDGVLERQSGGRTRVAAQPRTEKGIPDWVIDAEGALGYVEAKQPRTDLGNLTGRDKQQQERFLNLPNLLYTNFRDFELFEDGAPVARASLGPVEVLGAGTSREPSPQQLTELELLLERFVGHRMLAPRNADELAAALARATRVLRDAATDDLRRASSALSSLRREWEGILFAADEGPAAFADAYAQTVAYGFLTARLATDGPLTIDRAVRVLDAEHPFLGGALRLLTLSPQAEREVGWAVRVVESVVADVSLETFRRSRHVDDPLLYFYEDFLAAYDPRLREQRGVFYTPASVVAFQAGAVADVLEELGRPRLLADEDVVALDPATGTGTYPLALLDETAARLAQADLGAAQEGLLRRAARQLHGFELLVGPYTVAHQRVAAWLRNHGIHDEPVQIHLTDTLLPPEDLERPQRQLNVFVQQLVLERQAADEVKRGGRLLVVLGNPPYEREKGRGGGDWLQQQMTSFTQPVRAAARVNLKNLADSYVHFFRWALWALFEAPELAPGPRVLSFITNRSYLGGDAFEGLRLRLRERFDRLYVVDLGGESRGGNPEPNVFDIRVGVAIVVAVREDVAAPSPEAEVRYVRLRGTREDKELALKQRLDEMPWTVVERLRGESLLPELERSWARLPALDALMPFRQSGVETKRDRLVVGTTPEEIIQRLAPLADPDVDVEDRQRLFRETRDRALPGVVDPNGSLVTRYGYRPHDVRFVYNHRRFVDFDRPKLQAAWGPGQAALVTLPKGHGSGPAVVLQPELPDRHSFRGSYGGHVFPLWRDRRHAEVNLAAGVPERLGDVYGEDVEPLDVLAYAFGLLSAPRYSLVHRDELAQGFPRVPFTVDADLFARVVERGELLLDLHRGEAVPEAAVRLVGKPGPITGASWDDPRLRVAPSLWVEGLSARAWEYEVSGYRVLQRWIDARVGRDLARDPALGLDLLLVCAVVEDTVRLQPILDALLREVEEGAVLGRRAVLGLDLEALAAEAATSDYDTDHADQEARLWEPLDAEALGLAEEPNEEAGLSRET